MPKQPKPGDPRSAEPRARRPKPGADAVTPDSGSAKPAARRGLARVRPSGATVIMVVVILLGIAVLAPTVNQFVLQRQRIAQLQNEVVQTQAEIEALQTEHARWDDPAYIQAQARGRLLFVMPGDTAYLVVDRSQQVRLPEQNPVSPELQQTKDNWVLAFAQSLVTAGTSDSPGPAPAP